jgi:hypothetical protein
MATLAFTLPMLPGGREVLRQAAQEVQGRRRAEYAQFKQQLKLTTEQWFIQPTPQGELVTIYLEGEDFAHTFQTLAVSQDPFAVWFKEKAKKVHGVDYNQPPAGPLPERIL